jgi:hypothetical protein
VVAECRAGPLQLVDERDQVLHSPRREIRPGGGAAGARSGRVAVRRARGREVSARPTVGPRAVAWIGGWAELVRILELGGFFVEIGEGTGRRGRARLPRTALATWLAEILPLRLKCLFEKLNRSTVIISKRGK